MKTLRTISIVVIVAGILAALIIPIVTYKPKPPTKVDVKKLGKTIGDIRREFLKGYHDTTTVHVDSTELKTDE